MIIQLCKQIIRDTESPSYILGWSVRLKIELEFGVLIFVEEEKPENPEKNSRTRGTDNKLKPHVMPGSGIEPKPQQ